MGMCVEDFDACCSDRAADAGAWLTHSPPAGPTCLRWLGRQLFTCGDFLLEHGARDGSNPALTARTC